ncbi:MAG: hypothetical protein JNG90_19515 [Planctomycetaceae bacterium]|nr:hypothetical protein [Planctomycetaceae bacterium]
MLAFREFQRRAVASVLLTDLAEAGTWLPSGELQQPFPVRILVERSQQQVDGVLLGTEDEELLVTVWRDPDDAQFDEVNLGGVRQPRITDRLVRDPTRDTSQPYEFGGEIIAETPYTWRLRLRRKRVVQVGVGTVAR